MTPTLALAADGKPMAATTTAAPMSAARNMLAPMRLQAVLARPAGRIPGAGRDRRPARGRTSETDWMQIVEWYDELLLLTGSPVVRLTAQWRSARPRDRPGGAG